MKKIKKLHEEMDKNVIKKCKKCKNENGERVGKLFKGRNNLKDKIEITRGAGGRPAGDWALAPGPRGGRGPTWSGGRGPAGTL